MDGFLRIVIILFGLIVGSFLNVVIHRLPLGESLVRPRSRCPECKKIIRWYDNIPLLSYFLLRGKCRHCQHPISLRYPIVEMVTALLFYAARMKFGFSTELFVHHFPYLAILVAVTFIDLQHRIIPDELSLGGLVLGLATCWLPDSIGVWNALIGAAVGFGGFYLLAWGYEKATGRMGLGGGDVKLLAMIGAFIGPEGVLTTVLVSSVVGTIVGLAVALRQKRAKRGKLLQVAIPYGPFLVIGALIGYFWTGILGGLF